MMSVPLEPTDQAIARELNANGRSSFTDLAERVGLSVSAVHQRVRRLEQRGVIKGDRRASAIAAASIVAKVTRDRLMHVLHAADPRYGYDRHKGYATAEHLAAVARFGYSPQHRRTFRPATLFDNIV